MLMKSRFLFFVMVMMFNSSFAQNEDNADSVAVKSTVTVAALYSNNASYYGERPEEKTPYAAIALSYQLPSGFYLSGQTYKLLNDNSSALSAANIGAGINFNLSGNLKTDISYSHSFYPENSPLLQAANADNASVSVSYENQITISLTGDYAFGKTNDAFVTAAVSKQLSLLNIGQKDVVTITPSADIVGGTRHFYETYVKGKKLRDSLLGNLPIPVFPRPGRDREETVEKTSFNLLSYNFKFPLAYNRASYIIEAAYQLSLLSNKAETNNNDANSFFTFSFYYQF